MDSRKIEELSGFATFLEFLKNPEPVAKQIKELNAAVKDWKESNEKARGIKNIDDWRAGLLKTLTEQQAAHDARVAEFEKRMADEKAALDKSIEAHAKAKTKLADSQKLADAKLVEVDGMLKQKDDLAKAERRLDEKETRLQAMEKDLKDKMDKLSKLMSGA